MVYRFVSRDKCPACLSSQRIQLVELPFDSPPLKHLLRRCYPAAPTNIQGIYSVVSCDRCGTIYQVQVGDRDFLSELYERWVNIVPDRDWMVQAEWLASNPAQSRDGHEIITAAAMMRMQVADLKTLDYGMGDGLWARVSAKLGCLSYGYDLSERRTRLASSFGVRTLDFHEISDGEFNFINTEQVMEHVTDVDDVMERLASGLSPGGLLKISVPAQNRVRDALAELAAFRTPDPCHLDPAFPFEHVNAFTSQGLEILAKRFGLERVVPTRWQRLAFLRYPQSVSARNPKNAFKELARPFTRYESRRNLTRWFRAPKGRAGAVVHK